jgi:hypothetical protein
MSQCSTRDNCVALSLLLSQNRLFNSLQSFPVLNTLSPCDPLSACLFIALWTSGMWLLPTACTWQEIPLPIRQSVNLRWHYYPLKLNSWPHVMLVKWIFTHAVFFWDLTIPQEAATITYKDNDACTAMANAQKPTPHTWHMDIKYFALCDCVEQGLYILD